MRQQENTALREVAGWKHPVGTEVIVRMDDGSEVRTHTKYGPGLVGGDAVIWVEGVSGAYLLSRVRVVKPAEMSVREHGRGVSVSTRPAGTPLPPGGRSGGGKPVPHPTNDLPDAG